MFESSDEDELVPVVREGTGANTGGAAGDYHHDDEEIALLGRDSREEHPAYDFPASSFSRRGGRADNSGLTPAQRTLHDSGLAENVIREFDRAVPSEIENIARSLSDEQQVMVENQVRKESMTHWESRLIYHGLGTNERGDFVGLSLTRLNDLLCNVNEHLILMRRDIIQYGQAVDYERSRDTLNALGFDNKENRRKLNLIARSVADASLMLAVHAEKLTDNIEGRGASSSADWTLTKCATVTGLLAASGAAIYLILNRYK